MSETVPVLEAGAPQPPGAHWTGVGTNFAVFSAVADRVELCLFDDADQERARLALPARTGDIWHGFLPAEFGGIGTAYGYRVHGPYQPSAGHRCNPAKLLVDPAALALSGDLVWHPALNGGAPADDRTPDATDSAPWVPRCRVVDRAFDWGSVRRPHVPWRDTVIYELHVKGYTQLHPRVPAEHRGKFLGLAHPAVIDHLHRLGVTSVELMPCHAWVSEQVLLQRGLTNFWGYNPLAWFAPDAALRRRRSGRRVQDHGARAARGGAGGDTRRGLQPHGRGQPARTDAEPAAVSTTRTITACRRTTASQYENFSGTGNTVSFDHPAVRALVIDCLRYWVSDMGVDGFRFDLAPVLGRDSSGYSSQAPFFAALRSDPVLAYTKLIAEPWDVGPGGYQLGHFPAGWSEWNDRFRDTTRAFWRGDRPLLGTFAERFAGSSDLFRHHGRKPTATVNFVASHDGFTLADIVSYNDRHNEANLENGADGHAHNLSWNHGVEGADRRSRDHGTASPPDAQPPRHRAAGAGRADAARRRRDGAQPARQQQHLLPGQRAVVDRLGPPRAELRPGRLCVSAHPVPAVAAGAATGHLPQGSPARHLAEGCELAASHRPGALGGRLERCGRPMPGGADERGGDLAARRLRATCWSSSTPTTRRTSSCCRRRRPRPPGACCSTRPCVIRDPARACCAT